jgi:hypothetical protein
MKDYHYRVREMRRRLDICVDVNISVFFIANVLDEGSILFSQFRVAVLFDPLTRTKVALVGQLLQHFLR